MKKIISGGVPLLFAFLCISVFSFGQSVLLTPQKIDNINSTGTNVLLNSNNDEVGLFSRRFNGTYNARTSVTDNQQLLKLGAGGAYNTAWLDSRGYIKFLAAQNWSLLNYGTKIIFGTTPNGTFEPAERMTINHDGKVGIGTSNPLSNLQIHEGTTSFIQAMQITTDATGALATDGLGISIYSSSDIFVPRAARIMNNENGQLILGANSLNVMRITPTGNVGINSAFAPSARFQVYHDTENDATKPHINLVTAVDANNGMIKMTNVLNNRYFGQYFNLNSATPANNFVSFDYNGTTPILDMQGNGNIQHSGFTKLGADAPKIKMKTLTLATSGTIGGDTFTAHGLDATKIISYDALVDVGGTVLVKEGISTTSGFNAGREFSTEINTVNIRVHNHPTNSGNILSKTVKVVITYTE